MVFHSVLKIKVSIFVVLPILMSPYFNVVSPYNREILMSLLKSIFNIEFCLTNNTYTCLKRNHVGYRMEMKPFSYPGSSSRPC